MASVLFLLLSGFVVGAWSAPFGINYGQIADNLPFPENVVPILQSIGVKKVKLYDADPRVLRAFANTGVEFIVGLGNECLSRMRDQSRALAWIKANVQCHLPATKITCITVGNEVLTSNDTSLASDLLPAMQSMTSALSTLGIQKQVSITTAHSLAILETSYPPSEGRFQRDLVQYLLPILSFHEKKHTPFLINAYPYFAYKANPKQVPLDFVLFQGSTEVLDPISNLKYENMLFAQIDAVYSALAAEGHGRLPVKISETGWPSKGDEDEAGATVENAKKYNGNLMKVLSTKKGTPLRPNGILDVYVFALFNENLKPGPTSERNYGLFKPDGTPAYHLGLSSLNGSGTSSGGGGGRGGGSSGGGGNSSGGDGGNYRVSPPDGGSGTGFLTISSAPVASRFCGGSGLQIQLLQGAICAGLSLSLLFL